MCHVSVCVPRCDTALLQSFEGVVKVNCIGKNIHEGSQSSRFVFIHLSQFTITFLQ